MNRITALSGLLLLASVARAQDTTVVVVRHISAQQDTGVVVRHLAPAPQAAATQTAPQTAPQTARPYSSTYARPNARPFAQPLGAPRYGMRSTTVQAKDPYLGGMLSTIFPGGGQYYAGATAKGFIITVLSIGAPIIGYANVNRRGDLANPVYNGPSCPAASTCQSPCGGYGCSGYRNGTDWTPAYLGLGVGIGTWLYGIATAGTDVQHWNQAHGVRFVAMPGRAGFAVALP